MRFRGVACGVAALALVGVWAKAARADSPIVSGAGSTWSQVAIDQWRADVSRFGLRINYQGVGSSAGRSFYISNQVDFAVSEIPFEQTERTQLQNKGKQYTYLPIVAGGTSLMYNLRDTSSQPITTLRLSSGSLTGIFTGKITNWTDPAIKADNPGLGLPNEQIIPVIRSDGSGTSAQFTAFMSFTQHAAWCDFANKQGINCTYTSNYPDFPGSVSQSGSDGVANFVHSESSGQGAITYVETAYALQRGRPVAFLKNQSGNYTLPTSRNVSTALTKATLNPDHTQNLTGVYTNADPNAYAMSSYSYMIAPTNNFDTAKGNVLGQFMLYFACAGQRKADLLGYSPLPPNLVQVVFDSEQQVPGAPKPPPLNQCDNPTIQGGSGSVSNGTAGALSGGHSSSGATSASGAAVGGRGTLGAGGNATSGTGGGASGGGTAGNELGGTASAAGGGEAGNGATSGSGSALGYPQALPQISLRGALPSGAPLAASGLGLTAVVFGPPLLTNLTRRRRRQ
jgi:phosphate transport system substrate-binding protein